MAKVSIIGAGNVGATAGFLILEKKLADVVLVDIVDAVTAKALDMQQAGTIEGFTNTITGTKDIAEIKDSDIVVITAGKVRQPDMTREDLLECNSKIVKGILDGVKKYCPDAFLVMVTNPLDLIVDLVIKEGFDKKKVIGQSGVLDSARFMTFLGKNSEGMVVGYHSNDMIPLVSCAKVDSKDVGEVLDQEKIDQVVERTRKAGAEISDVTKTSAYYAPGAAIAKIVGSILLDKKELVSCCVYADGQYGLNDVCVGLPCWLGKDGVEVVEIKLSEEESNSLKEAVERRKKK